MTVSASKARSYALALLRYRGRSEKELRDRLRRKDFLSEDIDRVVEDLRTSGFLDDRSLAENLKRQAVTNKLLGHEGARRFMHQRGLSREIIDESLGYDEETEVLNMNKLIAKKLKTMATCPEPKRTRSLVGFLMRKGYRMGLIRKALNHISTHEEAQP